MSLLTTFSSHGAGGNPGENISTSCLMFSISDFTTSGGSICEPLSEDLSGIWEPLTNRSAGKSIRDEDPLLPTISSQLDLGDDFQWEDQFFSDFHEREHSYWKELPPEKQHAFLTAHKDSQEAYNAFFFSYLDAEGPYKKIYLDKMTGENDLLLFYQMLMEHNLLAAWEELEKEEYPLFFAEHPFLDELEDFLRDYGEEALREAAYQQSTTAELYEIPEPFWWKCAEKLQAFYTLLIEKNFLIIWHNISEVDRQTFRQEYGDFESAKKRIREGGL
ncbi:hypothetical protein OAN22_02340 [Alphaproteobacteria bacterium]|nr:hypothetical protein [Alphaproteobacteria bacterium]